MKWGKKAFLITKSYYDFEYPKDLFSVYVSLFASYTE